MEAMFGKGKVRMAPNVDEAVSLGAAIRAGLDASDSELNVSQKSALAGSSLRDVANKNYGTIIVSSRTGEKENSTIIRKDTPIPCRESQTFYTMVDGQVEVECEVTETAYDETDADLVPVKKRGLLALPPERPAGQEVRVTYSYDENQVVHCEFLDVATGRKENILLDLTAADGNSADFDINEFVID
jgi:molecular chaperone DnaK